MGMFGERKGSGKNMWLYYNYKKNLKKDYMKTQPNTYTLFKINKMAKKYQKIRDSYSIWKKSLLIIN